MSLAYDSGDEIPVKIAALYPDLFNCDVSEGYTPQEMSDVESDEKVGEKFFFVVTFRICDSYD